MSCGWKIYCFFFVERDALWVHMTWVSPLWPHSVGSILHSALWGQGDSKPAWLPTAAVRVQIGPLHCCTWTAWLNVFKKGNPKEFRLGQCPKVWLFLSDTVLLRTSPLINFYVDSTRRRVKDPFVNQLAARLYSTTGCNLVWSLATCFSTCFFHLFFHILRMDLGPI